MKVRMIPLAVAASAILALSGMASARNLNVGLAAEPSSVDPHYHNLGPNNALAKHLFSSLIIQDEQQRLQPGLAASWQSIDDLTWEFNLRQGVKFHDGSLFTANDFIYTACRVPNVPNSPSSFALFTKAIQSIKAKDDHTLLIKTDKPYPLLPTDMSVLMVLSASANGVDGSITYDKESCGISNWPKTSAFNDGSATIGTGPYRFKSFTKGDRLVLERNEGYWGEQPEWSTVTMKPITSAASRVAALLAGDVDFIDNPPVQDLPRLKSNQAIGISDGLSNRVIYLHMDQFGPTTPGVKGTGKISMVYQGEGPCADQSCEKNPLLDKRVRQALSMAIHRDAIVKKVMGGNAVAAGELLPPGFFGANPDSQPESYNPGRARELLAEAGYPNGFELTLGTPNDRYMNDSKVAQAIAQMFARIGVKTRVDAMTKSVFFKTRNQYEFSIYLAGWGAGTGEMSSPLRALVASRDRDRGLGGTNRGRYSNPVIDDIVLEALGTVNDSKRESLLKEASTVAMDDYAILPLHYEVTSWAHRSGLKYEARADQYTLAYKVKATD